LPVNGRNFAPLTLIPSGFALSQGQLGGYVYDPSGAFIPGAHLQIQNTSTGAIWSAITGSDGSWRALGLSSGNYRITATAPAFSALVANISYDAARPSAYRIALDVGAANSSVEVTASAPMLETEALQIIKDRKHKKEAAPVPPPPPAASANVFNLQQRVAGVLPVAVDVPRTGTSYRFVRPLVVNEETKLNFSYKTK
jgi:hypothetical protein